MSGSYSWVLVDDGSVTSSDAAPSNRLAQYIRGKPNMEALISAFRNRATELATTFADLITKRYLANATAAQLDVIGVIVGQARGDAPDDATYKKYIQARILANRSSGSVEEIYDVLELILPAGATLALTDDCPAGFRLVVDHEYTNTQANFILTFLANARAAAIRGMFFWRASIPSITFTLDGTSAQALDNGHFSGAATGPGFFG